MIGQKQLTLALSLALLGGLSAQNDAWMRFLPCPFRNCVPANMDLVGDEVRVYSWILEEIMLPSGGYGSLTRDKTLAVSSNGELLWEYEMDFEIPEFGSGRAGLITTADSAVYMFNAARITDSITGRRSDFRIDKIAYDGTMLWRKGIGDLTDAGLQILFRAFCPTTDKLGLVMAAKKAGVNEIFRIQIDGAGEVFQVDSASVYVGDYAVYCERNCGMAPLGDGHLIAYNSNLISSSKHYLAAVDSAGNLVGNLEGPIQRTFDLVATPDGGAIVSFRRTSTDNRASLIQKYGPDMELLWEAPQTDLIQIPTPPYGIYLQETLPEAMSVRENGDILIVFRRNDEVMGIKCLDAQGNDKWFRWYYFGEVINPDHRSYALLPKDIAWAPDGSIYLLIDYKYYSIIDAATGQKNQNLLIKLDSLGCFNAGCEANQVDFLDIIASTDDISQAEGDAKDKWTIFPNPANKIVYVRSSDAATSENILYQLLNVQGQIVSVGSLDNGGGLSVDGLVAGMYFLKLQDNDGRIYLKKIRVE